MPRKRSTVGAGTKITFRVSERDEETWLLFRLKAYPIGSLSQQFNKVLSDLAAALAAAPLDPPIIPPAEFTRDRCPKCRHTKSVRDGKVEGDRIVLKCKKCKARYLKTPRKGWEVQHVSVFVDEELLNAAYQWVAGLETPPTKTAFMLAAIRWWLSHKSGGGDAVVKGEVLPPVESPV